VSAALLATVLWAAAALGVAAVVGAIVRPHRRRLLLIVAALLFLPIGVLGILSVGAFFLAGALGCLIAAILVERSAVRPAQ
jgi:hypothetical protein